MTFWKRQCGDSKKVIGCQELEDVGKEGGWDDGWSAEDLGALKLFFMIL